MQGVPFRRGVKQDGKVNGGMPADFKTAEHGLNKLRVATRGGFECEANYAVFRTKLSELSTVFNVGRSIDVVVRTPQGLKFESKLVVYDSEMIPNSIIYPI